MLTIATCHSKQITPITEREAGGITSYLVPNGFRIVLVPFPSAGNTRIELLVKTGSNAEGAGETGMAHLLEHMLFKGAGNRSNLKDDLTKIGAFYNGTTDSNRTNFYETISSDPEKIDEAIKIEADRFIRAKFTAADLASEMTVVRNELENSERDPARLVMDSLNRAIFKWHGYSRAIIGARSDIESTKYEELKAFHKKHYRPDNAVLIVSGSFDKNRVLSLATELFSKAKNPAQSKQLNRTRDGVNNSTSRTVLQSNTATTLVASGWKLPSVLTPEVYALELAATAICSNDWGSLRKDLVLGKKIATQTDCFVSVDPDYSKFVAIAKAGKEADADEISKELVQHVENAAIKGVTQEQLDRAKTMSSNAFQRLTFNHEEMANAVSEAEVAGDWRLFLWARDITEAVTLEQANAALKKWIIPKNRNDVLLSHANKLDFLDFEESLSVDQLLKDKSWQNVIGKSDPLFKSLEELASATIKFKLNDTSANATLLKRKNLGNKVYLYMANDYGDFENLKDRKFACSAASSLIKYGGAGMSRDVLSQEMDKVKALWTLSLDEIFLEVPKEHLETAFSKLFSVWSKPALPVEEFERYRSSQISQLETALKDPIKLADKEVALRFDNFPDGSWSKPIKFEDSIKQLKQLNYEQVKDCSNDFSAISNARLAVVGDVDEEYLKDLWAKTGAKKSSKIRFIRQSAPAAPAPANLKLIEVQLPNIPNAKVTGVSVVKVKEDASDVPALELAIYAIGGNSSSIVWKKLREEQGLAYSAGMRFNISPFDERSTFEIFATSSSANAKKALESLQKLLSKKLDKGLTAKEIEGAKKIWKETRNSSLGEEGVYSIIMLHGMDTGHDFAYLNEFDKKIESVTVEEANSALRKYIKESLFVWSAAYGDNKP